MTKVANAPEAHEEILMTMATTYFTEELIALLRIRSPLIYVTCNEEKRFLSYFKHLSVARGYRVEAWDCQRGLIDLLTGKKAKGATDDMKDNEVILEKIIEQAEKDETNEKTMQAQGIAGNVFILLDYHRFMEDALPTTERLLKRLCDIGSTTTVIIVAPSLVLTPAVENLFQVLDFPYPNKQEIGGMLDTLVDTLKDRVKGIDKEAEERRDELIQSVTGLTIDEVESAFSKSIVKHMSFNIKTITDIKKQIISQQFRDIRE